MASMVGVSSATIVFSDNFDTENNGTGQLNYADFDNWTVSDGTVDLIGNGFWPLGQDPSHGLFLDMDGSTYNAGKISLKQLLDLDPGDYLLSFDLAGNHRVDTPEMVTAQVNMGGLFTKDYSLDVATDFTTITESFTVASATSVSLSFEGAGNDNVGMLLDNVSLKRVDQVPEPATMFLFGTGLAGLVGIRRRKK